MAKLIGSAEDAFHNFSFEDNENGDSFSLQNFDTKKLWNILDSKEKAFMKESKPKLIGLYLRKAASTDIMRCCDKVVINFDTHVSESTKAGKDARAMDLLRFFLARFIL